MTAKELVANLGGNHWRWGYTEFCDRMKLQPKSDSADKLWTAFKNAHAALAQFDEARLEIIFAPKDAPVAS